MTGPQLDRPTHATRRPVKQEALPAASAMPVFDSAGLLQGGCEILIRHGDEYYRLRHTRNDKLILTK
jgi:hemin uptake protein HemP